MNKTQPYLHYDSESSYLYHIGAALLPLIIYGFYKNGLLPLLNRDITFLEILRPLLFPLFGFLIGCLVDYICFLNSEKDTIWTHMPIYGTIIMMTMPLKANLFFMSILLFATFLLIRKLNEKKNILKPLPITKLCFVLLLTIMAHINFLNPTEQAQTMVYSTIDILFGRNIGGISTTSILWMVIAYAYLWFDYYYKKEIPLYSMAVYIGLCLLFEILFPTGNLVKNILNPSMIFASIFVATDIISSPYTDTGKMLYGLFIGLTGFFAIRLINSIDGVYIGIGLLWMIVPFLDKIGYRLEEKNDKFCRKAHFEKKEMKPKSFPKMKKNFPN